MIVDNIGLQLQPDDRTCVHTCLAMITGKSVFDVVKELDAPSGPTEYFRWLVHQNILPIQEHRLMNESVSLVTTPSRNKCGYLHLVVVDLRYGRMDVFDPQYGKPDREYIKDFDDMHSFCNPVRLVDCSNPISPGEV